MFIFVCVPTCVQCTHTRALCMWRPGDNIRCCSSAYGFVESRSFTDLKVTSRLGRVASEPQGSACLCLFSLLGLQENSTIPNPLCRFWGLWLSSSFLSGKDFFFHISYFLSSVPTVLFFKVERLSWLVLHQLDTS